MVQYFAFLPKNLTGALADLRGGARDVCPPLLGPNFFNFMQFLGKISKNNRLAPPPLQLVHPPLGKSWIRHCGE